MELTHEEIKRIREATRKTNPPESGGGIPIYTCPICGKKTAILDAKQWTFKRLKSKANNCSWIYFCGYSCARKFDAAYNLI